MGAGCSGGGRQARRRYSGGGSIEGSTGSYQGSTRSGIVIIIIVVVTALTLVSLEGGKGIGIVIKEGRDLKHISSI